MNIYPYERTSGGLLWCFAEPAFALAVGGGFAPRPSQPSLFILALAFQAVLFDLDGVLIRSEQIHDRARHAVLDHYGIYIPDTEQALFRGQTTEAVFGRIAQDFAEGRASAAEMMALKRQFYYEQAEAHLALIPGALDFVRRLTGTDVRLAVVTSASPESQGFAFKRFNLASYFSAVVTAADVEHGKPAPDPYLLGAERLGTAPTRCLVIEDSVSGIQAAKAAGCTAAGLTTSFSASELLDAGADVAVESFDELTRYLPGETR